MDKLPTPAYPFGADALACALTLTGSPYPTPAQLDAALLGMYPVGGPTAASLVAAGWLLPTIDKKGLRKPPLTPAEVDARLADKEREADAKPAQSEPPANGIETECPSAPLFSYYRGPITNQVPHAAITPAQLFTVLTSGRCRAATEALRAAPVGSSQRAELKKSLDYVTPAGTFTRRANDALLKPSGLLPLDFDHMPDVAAARAALLADALLAPELVLLFTSPSGDGLKVFVRTDPTAAHGDNFRAYADYLTAHYAPLGLSPDAAGKDVARACFVPYAPDAWLAPAYAA